MLMGTAYFRFLCPQATDSSMDTKVSEDEEEPYGHIVSKLSVLQMLIDTYYLDEVDNEALATGIYKDL